MALLLLLGALVPFAGLPAFQQQQAPLRVEIVGRVARPELEAHAAIVGSLVDAGTSAPIPDATVTVGARTALTDASGEFRAERLDPGASTIEIAHVAYGTQRARLELAPGVELRVRLSATSRPIPVDSLNVTTWPSVEQRRRASPTRLDILAGPELDILAGPELEAARVRGETVAQVVKRFPGIRVRYGRFTTTETTSTGACVESSTRATPRLMRPSGTVDERVSTCEPLPIFVDDVYVGDPVGFLHNLRLDDFEEVEVLPEIQAGARYGVLAGNGGVLLLRTRRR